jgi:cation:H+ antiporter
MLWKSADLLVAGAVVLAQRLGVSPLIIGLTIVAMGTSAPEVAASIVAAVGDNGDAAIGNVFGSNIANLALVGGLVALIRPLRIQLRTLRREIPVMLLMGLLLWPVLHNSYLSRPEGFVLLIVFAGLILLTVYAALKDTKRLATGNTEKELKPNSVKPPNSVAKENERNTQYAIRNTKKSVLFIVIGLVGLALGAEMAVKGAVFIGGRIGLSDAVIGLTIIAIGTSLPELATCLVAASGGLQHLQYTARYRYGRDGLPFYLGGGGPRRRCLLLDYDCRQRRFRISGRNWQTRHWPSRRHYSALQLRRLYGVSVLPIAVSTI